MSVEFIDELPEARGPGRTARHMTPEVRADLESNPGKWALITTARDARAMKAVHMWCTRHDGYEATTRFDPASEAKSGRIYVRFTPTTTTTTTK